MRFIPNITKISSYIGIVLIFVTLSSALLPLLSGKASAALVQSRSITLSSSATGALTTYHVAFNWATTGNVQGIVVDFCDDSPMPGFATCTTPSGFSISASPAVSGQSSTAGGVLTSFTSATPLNSNRTLALTAASAVSMTAGVSSFFDLTTVTNPSTANHTFYARLYTYATAAGATGYTVANPSAGAAIVDSGGFALSTVAQISFSFDISESLTFCVYTGGSCGSGVSFKLGNTNGVLSTAGPYVDKSTKYDITTNAGGGSPVASIFIKGNLPTSGANTIASIGNSATGYTVGPSQFGLCSYRVVGGPLSIQPPYNNSAGSGGICSGTSQTSGTGSTGGDNSALFAFNTANVTSTYGDLLATVSPTKVTSTGQIAFIGGISPLQPAGEYKTSLSLIATGSY